MAPRRPDGLRPGLVRIRRVRGRRERPRGRGAPSRGPGDARGGRPRRRRPHRNLDATEDDAGVPRSTTRRRWTRRRAILCGDVDDVLGTGDASAPASSAAAGAASAGDRGDDRGRRPPRVVTGINAGKIGPELARLREAQEREHGAQEYYTAEHYDRLYGRRRPWGGDGRGARCGAKTFTPPGAPSARRATFAGKKPPTSRLRVSARGGARRRRGAEAAARGAGGAWRCAWARTSTRRSRMPSGGARCAATSATAREPTASGQARAVPHAAAHARGHRARVAERGALPHHPRIVAGADAPPILDLPLAQRAVSTPAPSVGAGRRLDAEVEGSNPAGAASRRNLARHERKSRTSAMRARVASGSREFSPWVSPRTVTVTGTVLQLCYRSSSRGGEHAAGGGSDASNRSATRPSS